MMTQGGINGVSIIFLCGTIPEISIFVMFQLKRKKEVFEEYLRYLEYQKKFSWWGIHGSMVPKK